MRSASGLARLDAWASVALFAFFALFASACSHDDASPYFGATARIGKSDDTFYIKIASEPEYLDPGKSGDTVSSAMVMQLFEGLTSDDPRDGHPVQGAATRWDVSADNRLFRFHLRPEARWSDGKPVRAQDFAYAWKRVLRPATASRSVSNLYPLKNGELFSQGKLQVTLGTSALRAEPRPDAPERARLPVGTAVQILARSPQEVATSVTPLSSLPVGAGRVQRGEGGGKDEILVGGARRAAEGDGGWKGATVEVLAVGPSIECDDGADRWLLIRRGDRQGYLPGCLLAPATGQKTWALVERFDRRPTFSASPSPAEPAEPMVTGFLEEEELVMDESVIGVRASSDLVLDVELEQPTPYFTSLTSYPTLFPVREDVVEAFERRGEGELWVRPENIVTNGPYVLDEWKFQYEITMKQSPTYWDRERMKTHRIVWLEVDQSNTGVKLYKAGQVDYLGDDGSMPSEYLPIISGKKDYLTSRLLQVEWYEFNTRKPPFDDVRVRRAFNLAVDKAEIVEKVVRGGRLAATHYVPDYTGLGYSALAAAEQAAGTSPFAGPDVEFNPARARALMKEAGYEVVKDGDAHRAQGFPAVELLYNYDETLKQAAVAIQDMWKRHLGVSVGLRSEDFKVMLKSQRQGQFQVMRLGWTADYDHPQTFLDTFRANNPQNQMGWSDKAYEETLKEAAATPDPDKSIALYRKAEAIALQGMARMPLYFETQRMLVKPWVKGLWGTKLHPHLVKYLWIDPAWERGAANEPAFAPLEFPQPGRIMP